MVDRGDAQLDRVEVLVSDVDAGQEMRQHGFLPRRAAIGAVGERLAAYVGLGQFILVVPARLVDHVVDVGPIGPIGVGEDAQCRFLDAAAVLLDVGERVGAHIVVGRGLLRRSGKQRRLCEQFRLQRQQIAEDAGQRDDAVDAAEGRGIERDKLGAAHPPIAVVAGGPRP